MNHYITHSDAELSHAERLFSAHVQQYAPRKRRVILSGLIAMAVLGAVVGMMWVML